VGRYPERLIGFIRLDPNQRDAARAALDRAVVETGFRGVKLHPTTTLAHPAGAPTISLLERAAELGVPVLFHCGDDPYTTPQAIELAAARVPACTVVMGHMGGYFHVDDAIAAAVRQPNIVLETSAMPYPWKVADAVRAVGPDRVVFGSDGPGCSPSLEVRKIRQLGLEPEAERAVLAGTASRLLRLDSPRDAGLAIR
jgi:predicted TIM-barrel fold metal-dependent hydrolase